jgi:hypothetical protein
MSHSVNFLQAMEPEPQRRPRRRKRFVVILASLVGLALAAWIGVILVAAGQVMAAALDGKDALVRARDAAVDLEFDTALNELAAADQHLSDAERGLVMLRTASFAPWVGAQVETIDAILSSSRNVIDALSDIVEIGDELLRLTGLTQEDIRAMAQGTEPSMTFDDLSSETKRALLTRLSNSADDLELTEAKINIALSDLDTISRDETIAPVLDALDPIVLKLREMQTVVHTLAVGARLLPEFAGLGQERAHLLLFMNNTELRPGGGFIGTYGTLKMLDGDIEVLKTSDVYTLDDAAAQFVKREAPGPLRTYNGATKWFFRDSNWLPDFAYSSQQGLDMFREEDHSAAGITTFNGVIGLTPTYVSDLLRITGPIEAGGQVFNADNFADKLEYQVEFGYAGQDIPPEQRKEIIADLVSEMKEKLYALSLSGWLQVLDTTELAFTQKQLVLYSGDQATQDVIEKVGWGGRITPGTPDVQMVVDANLASLKTDPSVSRDITYQIFQNSDGQWIGRTTIHYAHHGVFNWKTTRYRTYSRLYVPDGSAFVSGEGALKNDAYLDPSGAEGAYDVGHEFGLTVFGAFTSIEPGQNRDLVFEYALAPQVVEAIEAGAYDLTVYKQIGAAAHSLTLDLQFGKNVGSAVPAEDAQEWGDGDYQLNTYLDQDRGIQVRF